MSVALDGIVDSFEQTLRTKKLNADRTKMVTLQVNIGKRCNQACHHCHVEAGPLRKENMERETVDRLISLLGDAPDVQTVDITGGAPELNPHFRHFVSAIREMGKSVIDRCNLTVLFEPGQEDTAEFLADHQVQVVASLPCYTSDNVDKQRGRGVFGKSIDALQKLNSLGYGKEGTGLELNLVYNPLGAFLPPGQVELQNQYKDQLKKDFGIEFNQLFTITNMPIKRFSEQLNREGKTEEYMQLLLDNFNPTSVEAIMCRTLISIGYDGQIYDCDFNQMLEIPAAWKKTTIWDINAFSDFDEGKIAFKDHCYGCTAGAGSSCGGSLV